MTTEFDVDESLLQDEHGEFQLAAAATSSNFKHLLPELFQAVEPDDFYLTGNGEIWRAAKSIHDAGKRISRRSILVEMIEVPNREALVERVYGQYVDEAELYPSAVSVREKSRWRGLTQALKRSAQAVTEVDSYDEAMEFAHAQLRALSENGGAPLTAQRFGEMVDEWLDWLNEDPENSRVFPTPWDDLNERLAGGLHSMRTYIMAGRPGHGKTIGALNMAAHVAETGGTALVFSLEMPRREVTSRIVAAQAEANYGQITKREIDSFNLNRIGMFVERASDLDLYVVDDSSVKIEKMWAIAKQMKQAGKGPDVIVIDHIGLVRASNSRVGREQQLSHISWMCTLMAKDLDCAVLIAAQLNRGPAQDNSVPKPSDLRESGTLEQNADVVMLLHHEEIEGIGTGEVQIHLGKNRTGVAGAIISLPYRPHMAKFG
nr:DnaB-like helicase C-terminal domain-containing protein [Rhodococcus sp. (in: high G+C Gram-positive bacteria)]